MTYKSSGWLVGKLRESSFEVGKQIFKKVRIFRNTRRSKYAIWKFWNRKSWKNWRILNLIPRQQQLSLRKIRPETTFLDSSIRSCKNIEFNSNILRVWILERHWTTEYHYDAFYLPYPVCWCTATTAHLRTECMGGTIRRLQAIHSQHKTLYDSLCYYGGLSCDLW